MGEILALMIPITALMIPIVVIFTNHQQKMARIIHESKQAQHDPEVAQLRTEVYQLKEMVHQQMLALDAYSTVRPRIDSELQDTLSGKR